MKTVQFLSLCVLALAGGVIGGHWGAPTPAKAQTQIRSENQIVVPDEGLRFVTMRGRTVAVMGLQDGNSVLALLDNAGRPSVTLIASPGGSVTLRSKPDGGEVEVSTADGSKLARLVASASGATIEAVTNKSTLSLLNTGAGTTSLFPGANGATALMLATGASGGSVTVYGPGSKSALTVEGNASGGLLTVRDANATTTATVTGAGTFAALRAGRTVWQAPPAGTD
jgi:hypothetical protein